MGHNLALFAFGLSLALCGCASGEGGAQGDEQTGGPSEGIRVELLGVEALKGEDWNLATLGRRKQGVGYLSKGAKVIVDDLWLIQRATGATSSLVPDGVGRVERSYFLSGTAGPIADSGRYSGSGVHSDDAALRYYLIVVSRDEKQEELYAGLVADIKTVKLGGPYSDISHMDMLEGGELAVYAMRGNEARRIVFDLNSMSELSDKALIPDVAQKVAGVP